MIAKLLSLGAAAVAAAAIGGAAQAAPNDSAACAAALDVVKGQLVPRKDARPWAVIGSAGSRDDGLTAQALRKGLRADPPSQALAARFVGQNERDPLEACPEVLGLLERRHVVHDQAVIDQILAKAGKDAKLYPIRIFSLSLPVIGADGRDALTDTGETGGADRVRGWVVHLRKDAKGHWREVAAFTNITG